ncbi:ROK family protein [Enterococcus ureasiticus]|uniref:ROK family protein n=1 Tax=Enterococcus ureasiticus TaxID=903984 RepID=UPI001A8BF812|nr:ROK family protein [Enterococcus ureasiticus]MBO0474314.1 ROK family protein [Enterococcus ureasiticus]
MEKILVLDIGGTFIKYGLIISGKLEWVKKQATPKKVEAFKNCLNLIKNEFLEDFTGVSISMPGIINADSGFAVHGGSLEFIRQMDIREFYESIFECPVTVDNDARCGIIGEMNQGQLKRIENAAMIVLGTGVGGGLIVNGQLVRGFHQSAGELSLVQTNSAMNLTDLFAVKNSVYSLLKPFAKALGQPTKEVSGEAFFEAIENEDPAAQTILHGYCDSLAVQIWNLQAILDPEKIVIGGGISSQPILLDYIKQSLQKNVDSLNVGPLASVIAPAVVLSSLGNDANLIGAYYNFINKNTN